LNQNTVRSVKPVASQKFKGAKNVGRGQNVWYWANNTILFGITPLKAQNGYMF